MYFLPNPTLESAARDFRDTLSRTDTQETYIAARALLTLVQPVSHDAHGAQLLPIPAYDHILTNFLDDNDGTEDRPGGIEDADVIYIAVTIMQSLSALEPRTEHIALTEVREKLAQAEPGDWGLSAEELDRLGNMSDESLSAAWESTADDYADSNHADDAILHLARQI